MIVFAILFQLFFLCGAQTIAKHGINSTVSTEPKDRCDANRVTATAIDDKIFNKPHIQVDEWRDQPTRHRYVRGIFNGTGARFSFYFPPKENYQKRFHHNTYPLATSSDIGPFPIAFDVATGNLEATLDSGAYYVQTNQGSTFMHSGAHFGPFDPGSNAAAAVFSRKVAAQMYGDHRPYGYLYGGSGGALQTVAAAESSSGIWDGFLPYVYATPYAIPATFTIRLNALRMLKKSSKWTRVMDAISPGGSGAPYDGLTTEEAAALKEATLFGVPPQGWWNWDTLDSGYMQYVLPMIRLMDMNYSRDFWSKPGYAGSNKSDPIQVERVIFNTRVANVTAGSASKPLEIEFTTGLDKMVPEADIYYLRAGMQLPLPTLTTKEFSGKRAILNAVISPKTWLKPGDEVRIDNSWILALGYYQRHAVPPQEFHAWDQYRDGKGNAIYPQRMNKVSPKSGQKGQTSCSGHISAKMLMIDNLMDIDAHAWSADWYRSKVKQAGLEDSFALQFLEHAQHDNPSTTKANAFHIPYDGAINQGLRDLASWVERGERPKQTSYKVVDNLIELPVSAAARGGIQPLVDLRANGNLRTEVKVGQAVNFMARYSMPPGAGMIVDVRWDYEGIGTFPHATKLNSPQEGAQTDSSYAYTKPGTYFAVVKVASNRRGDLKTPHARIYNIARAKVVVS